MREGVKRCNRRHVSLVTRVTGPSFPVIPVTEGVDWYQYNTKDIAGWVTQSNKFAKPAAYEHPDWGVMLLHLKAKR